MKKIKQLIGLSWVSVAFALQFPVCISMEMVESSAQISPDRFGNIAGSNPFGAILSPWPFLKNPLFLGALGGGAVSGAAIGGGIGWIIGNNIVIPPIFAALLGLDDTAPPPALNVVGAVFGAVVGGCSGCRFVWNLGYGKWDKVWAANLGSSIDSY
jgi:hypothetical protein